MELHERIKTEFQFLSLQLGIKKFKDYLVRIPDDKKNMLDIAFLAQEIFGGKVFEFNNSVIVYNRIDNKNIYFNSTMSSNSYENDFELDRADYFKDDTRKESYEILKRELDKLINAKVVLCNEAIALRARDCDSETNVERTEDLFLYTTIICEKLIASNNDKFDYTVVELCSYWQHKDHKVHESLANRMRELDYSDWFINKCLTVLNEHNWEWDKVPSTLEGKILLDADKVSVIGRTRWLGYVKNHNVPSKQLELLPRVRNEFLWLEESKPLFDNEIAALVQFLGLQFQPDLEEEN